MVNEEFDSKYAPSDDLFRYVNGHWLENVKIPDDKPRWGSFDELAENSLNIQRELLEDSAYDDKLPLSKTLYRAFMDIDAINKAGTSPILPILEGINTIDSWTKWSVWTKDNFASLGVLPVRWGISNDIDNPDYNTLHFFQGGLLLPDESYYTDQSHADTRAKFTVALQNLLNLVGYGNAAKADKFCEQIAKMHWDIAKCRDVELTHNPMQLSALATLAPNLNLPQYFSASGEVVVDVAQTDFLENIDKLWVEKHLDDWKNLAICGIIRRFAGKLSDEAVNASFELSRILTGTDKLPERWKRGVAVANAVGDEIGKVYVDLYFNDIARKKMAALVDNLLLAYNKSITAASWLGDETKSKALEKLRKFVPHIGFPQHWHDYTKLELGEDVISNSLALSEFAYYRDMKKVGEKVDKLEWHMTPQTVNAYYNPPDNVIVFPAAILQPPFFDIKADDAANYGGIGAVIGHEIGHGFDDQGAMFNGDGALQDWWTADDKAKFRELTDKLNAQFEKFTPLQLATGSSDDPHVNGALTTGENVGDVAGIKIALLAYALSRGFDSIEQLAEADAESVRRFFYGYALIWRGKGRDEYVRLLLAIDPHSPAEFRANTVRNIDAFHEVFNTTESSALWLPIDERVNIW